MKFSNIICKLLAISSSDNNCREDHTQYSSNNNRNEIAKRKAIERSSWRYTSTKPSIWDTRKSKIMKFSLRHVGNNNDNIAEVGICKKKAESLQHVLGKGLIWAMYRGQYPNIFVEADIGDKRLPDVVAFEKESMDDYSSFESLRIPIFWGESGRMSPQKAAEIAMKFPNTHFCHLRWGVDLEQCSTELGYALRPTLKYRAAPFEFGVLKDDPRQYVDEDGNISISRDDADWKVFMPTHQ